MMAICCSRMSLANGFSGWVVTLSTGFSSCPYCRGEAQVEKRDNGQEAEVGTGGTDGVSGWEVPHWMSG